MTCLSAVGPGKAGSEFRRLYCLEGSEAVSPGQKEQRLGQETGEEFMLCRYRDEYTGNAVFLLSLALLFLSGLVLQVRAEGQCKPPSRLKTSLNAYSFNGPLSDGSMSLEDLIEYCAREGFDAVDITAYYFPGYPEVPPDEYLYRIKRKAFSAGLEISGTGVRTDFTDPDASLESIRLVKDWIIAAEKLGAPVIRIFAGKGLREGYTRAGLIESMLPDIRECVEFGSEHGVVVGIQNHNDFITSAEEAIEIISGIDSPWFGLILDIGSFRRGDPYLQIEQAISHAVSWQIKEEVYRGAQGENTDLARLVKMIRESGYRGYIPIETLGSGDPFFKVHCFLKNLNGVLENSSGE